MELAVKTLEGKAAGKATVDAGIFGLEEIRGDLLQRTVRWQLAKRQAGTHKTQERADVSVTTNTVDLRSPSCAKRTIADQNLA